MKKLFSLIEKEAVDVVLIEYPDRLVRLGFPDLQQAFAWPGVRLEVLEEPEKQDPLAEMTADQARKTKRMRWGWCRVKSMRMEPANTAVGVEPEEKGFLVLGKAAPFIGVASCSAVRLEVGWEKDGEGKPADPS